MAITVRSGRWGLTRIMADGVNAFTTAALQQAVGVTCNCHYPPLNPARTAYTLPFALVCFPNGVSQGFDADVRLFPDVPVTATWADLTNPQRVQLRNGLEEWLAGYAFTDWDGTQQIKRAFSGAGFTVNTPLVEVIRAVFAHLANSESRPRPNRAEDHNTEYLDSFSTDPSGRWTFEIGTWTWDSGNNEVDVDVSTDLLARYSANEPGSIEHEAQVTQQSDPGGGVSNRMLFAATRINNAGADDGYSVYGAGLTGNLVLERFNAGVRTTISSWLYTHTAGNFYTGRLASSGGNGANVVIDWWLQDNGGSKPSDPGWFGDDGSPDDTFTDTDADRLDDASVNLQCGIAGRGSSTSEYDTRHCFWKSRAISDRGGEATGDVPWNLRRRQMRPAPFRPGLAR